MLHPALRLLMRLQAGALLRRSLRSMRRPKGIVFTAIAVLVFLPWFASLLFTASVVQRSDPQTVRLVVPVVMLGLCILTLMGGEDRIISFSAGEVNFLFPGPFSRRELLLYKLARTVLGSVFSGLILSLAFLQHAAVWFYGFVACTLGMLLVQLLTLLVTLVGQVAGARAYSLGRRAVLALLLGALVLTLAAPARHVFHGGISGLRDAAEALRQSSIARVVLAPFVPFARTYTAGSFPSALMWAAACAAIDAVGLLLIVRLDSDYREVSLVASQKRFDRLQRLHRGQMLAGARPVAGRRRTRVPMLPWLGGAGPTAWRQLATGMRTAGVLLAILFLLSLGVAPTLLATKADVRIMLPLVGWIMMFVPMILKLDFRAELDQMEWLKALPLSPFATAAGQLMVPSVLLTFMQGLLLGGTALVAPPAHRVYMLAALPFLLPFNLLLLGVENLLFLLFPSRPVGAAPGDIGQMGRNVLQFLLKIFVLLFVCGIAAVFGVISAMLTGGSVVVGVVAALPVMCLFAGGIVPCVGWAYKRFDPSSDTPA